MSVSVEVLKVGHAFINGERGEKGGAPSKDSIWGVAKISGNPVKFFGRRGGKLRFKVEKRSHLDEALAMFNDKVEGKGMKYHYDDITRKTDLETLASKISVDFRTAKKEGKLNTRSTQG